MDSMGFAYVSPNLPLRLLSSPNLQFGRSTSSHKLTQAWAPWLLNWLTSPSLLLLLMFFDYTSDVRDLPSVYSFGLLGFDGYSRDDLEHDEIFRGFGCSGSTWCDFDDILRYNEDYQSSCLLLGPILKNGRVGKKIWPQGLSGLSVSFQWWKLVEYSKLIEPPNSYSKVFSTSISKN
jgi:hypothetical protein